MISIKVRSTYGLAGFSLIEILVVLAIISILAVMAIPSKKGQIDRVRVNEALSLIEHYKKTIEAIYMIEGEFPLDNEAAGLPMPNEIVGNFLSATYIDRGAFHLQLGNKISADLQGKTVSVRPIFVPDVHNAPVSWICGNDTVPNGMIAAGENRTNIGLAHLPLKCR